MLSWLSLGFGATTWLCRQLFDYFGVGFVGFRDIGMKFVASATKTPRAEAYDTPIERLGQAVGK